jgi:hypothetical protein
MIESAFIFLIGFGAGFFVMFIISRIATNNLIRELRSMSDSLLRLNGWRNDLLASRKRAEL